MMVCDECKKEIGTNSIETMEQTPLGKKHKIFCKKECLLIHYDKPFKPKNEFFEKFSGKKKQNIQERIETAAKEITVKDIRKNEGEVDPIELGKPLV
jgi:hypothetical protein